MDVVTLGAALKGAKAYTDATIAPLLGGVHYRGSVNYFNNLPSNPAEGDAYTVKYLGTSGTSPDGTEYVWALDTDDNTYKWIGFSPDTYTKAEVDNLLSGKQATIDSSHKLSADLVDDTSTTHKFATAAELQQIETNKTNILLNYNALCQNINSDTKNRLKLNRDRIKELNVNGTWVDYTFTPTAQPNLHITINEDFSITYTGTSNGEISVAIYAGRLPDLQGYVLSGTTKYNNNYVSLQKSVSPYTVIARDEGNGTIISEYSNAENLTLNVTIRVQTTDVETTMLPMICSEDYWNVTKTYVPYNYTPDYATCYTATSNDGTFAGVLANVIQNKGVSGVISYIASVYTATSNEYLLLYGLFNLNTSHYCVKIVNNTINFVAVNNGGTIAVSGGTGAYTIKIKLLI